MTISNRTYAPLPKPTGTCFCGCGAPTSQYRYFAQGHDKKAESDLNAIHSGDNVVSRLIFLGYGPGGRNLHETAVELGVRELCGIDGCTTTGRPGGPGLSRHRREKHGVVEVREHVRIVDGQPVTVQAHHKDKP